MIRYHLKNLIAEKEFKEKRIVSIKEISEAIGVSRSTLSKIANNKENYNSTAEIIEKLCKYFGCEIPNLMTIIPGESESP
jgi:putative transcriptional regulator